MGRSSRLRDFFPLVAGAIERVSGKTGQWALHEEIVREVLSNAEAAAVVAESAARSQKGNSPEWLADNYVAWFSAWITEGRLPEYGTKFRRERRQGAWAYALEATARSRKS